MKAKIKTFFSPLVIGILIGVFFTATASFAAYTLIIKPKLNPPTPPVVSLPSPTLPAKASATAGPNDSVYGTLSWLSGPQKITNPEILVKLISTPTAEYSGGYSFADLGTYRVGKFSGGANLLVAFILPEGPSSPIPFRLIEDKGKYSLIESLVSADYVKKELDNIFDKSKVSFISFQIKELYPEYYYSINQMNFSKIDTGFSSTFYSQLSNPSLISSVPAGDILLVSSSYFSDSNDFTSQEYYLKLKDFTLVSLERQLGLATSDNHVPYFNNLDNSANKTVFEQPRGGCGSDNRSVVIKNQSVLNDKVLIGKNNNGLDLYQIKTASNNLIKSLYINYKAGREYPSAPPILSIDQFAAAPNHIIFQEKNSDWIILINPEYAVQAECGKPVIYLYPTKDTQISVKVGADITQSEPLYPTTGWTVLAHPDGQLDYQGRVYPNLFWEGTGQGIYPDLKNFGFVVSQKNLLSTLKNHLKQLGLNTQETSDFLEFWTPLLPISPYVRLTWLGTVDMNRLAPFSVTPRPDTVIRIFLDFASLDQPISLIPQKLSSLPRRGFTLVEWGGLLVK